MVNLYRNTEARPQPAVVHDVLHQKCRHRDILIPTLTELERRKGDLEGSWESMLGHQLQALSPVESFWNELPDFFASLHTGVAPSEPEVYEIAAGETVLRERTLRLPVATAARSFLEIIRFAAANHVCVDLRYQSSVRRIEPYSLRRTRDGNIVLHAVRNSDGEHRSYRIDRIEGAKITGRSFVPRYVVELSPRNPIAVPPAASRAAAPTRQRRRTRAARSGSGPHHIYECTYCGKRFRRKKRTTHLNPHKDKYGYPCPGRMAMFVDIRY